MCSDSIKGRFKKLPLQILLSAAIGGMFCILSDLAINGRNSLFINIVENLNASIGLSFVTGIIILMIILPLLSLGLCFVFQPVHRVMSFYLGASILAILFNFVPMNELPGLKTEPNSARVDIVLIADSSIDNVEVTIVNSDNNRIVGRRTFQGDQFFFYIDDGNYKVRIIIPGYAVIRDQFSMIDDTPLELGPYHLLPSNTPNNLLGLF